MEHKKLCYSLHQWEHLQLDSNYPRDKVFQYMLELLKKEQLSCYKAQTAIMIVPGYDFQIVEGLITNFHQPSSTLLMLVAALIGEEWKRVYAYAMQNGFRFLSYGDSSLLFRDA